MRGNTGQIYKYRDHVIEVRRFGLYCFLCEQDWMDVADIPNRVNIHLLHRKPVIVKLYLLGQVDERCQAEVDREYIDIWNGPDDLNRIALDDRKV